MYGKTTTRFVLALALAAAGVGGLLWFAAGTSGQALAAPAPVVAQPAPPPPPKEPPPEAPSPAAPQGGGSVYCVTPSGGGPYAGCDQVFTTVQAAVDAASAGTTIKVAQGVYADTDVDGRVVYLPRTLTLQGGYTDTNWLLPDPQAHPTILDGQSSARGLVIAGGTAAVVQGFHIRNGHASGAGGGVYILGGTPTLAHNRVYSNSSAVTAGLGCGGIYIAAGAPRVENNLIYNNRAAATAAHGGGVCVAGGDAALRQNTLALNVGGGNGGGIYIAAGAPTILGNVFAQNLAASGSGVYAAASSAPVLDYNVTWNNDFVGDVPFGNVRSGDPLFVNAAAGDFHLQAGSPCIDWLPITQTLALDHEGRARPFGPLADAGGHEFYSGTCFARLGSGQVYTTVQAAVDAASSGDLIRVAGTCSGVEWRNEMYQAVYVDKDLTLRGGYGIANWQTPDPVTFPTVLDARGEGRVVVIGNVNVTLEGFHITNGSVTNNGAGIYVSGGTVTIQHNRVYSNVTTGSTSGGGGIYVAGGNATLADNQVYQNATVFGGGIYIAGGSVALTGNAVYSNAVSGNDSSGGGIYIAGGGQVIVHDNDIYSNTVNTFSYYAGGGGVYIYNGDQVHLSENTIHDNQVDNLTLFAGGGGIYIGTGAALIEDNDIYNNTASAYGGGGLYLHNTNATIRNCRIHDNVARDGNNGGGAFYIYAAAPTIEANDIYSNSAPGIGPYRGGGAFFIEAAAATIRNNLIRHNQADNVGGGFYLYSGASTVENNTIYANSAGVGGGMYAGGGNIRNNVVVNNVNYGIAGPVVIYYSDIWNNTVGNCSASTSCLPGNGNIFQNPLFVNAAGGDFHLQSTSPCIDTAHPSSYPPGDYAGYARPFGPRADMGAYEFYSGTCFARIGAAGQVYADVQPAVDAAAGGGEVRVAGLCQGVHVRLDGSQPVSQTVFISRALTLRGGYTVTNWTTPGDLTILNPLSLGRAIYVTGAGPVVVDGFVLRNGSATTGGGLYQAAALALTVQNVLFHSNSATNGGGLATTGGTVHLYNDTFAGNTATSGGGLYLPAAGTTISNAIIANNAGGSIATTTPITLTYSDVWGNTGCDWCANVHAGSGSFSADPLFVNPGAGDYHLLAPSPCIHSGDPRTTLTRDIEGDARPLGRSYDIGADESTLYPDVSFAPDRTYYAAPHEVVVSTHYLTNTGSISDDFDLVHDLTIIGPATGWSVDYPASFALAAGAATEVPVTITVPANAISGTAAIVVITATSQLNPSVYDTVLNSTIVNWNPGVRVTPVYSERVNPGTVITYLHTLHNSGNFTDTFTILWNDSLDWTHLVTPLEVLDLGPDKTAELMVVVAVPATAPGGLVEQTALDVQGVSGARTVVTDTTTVNHTTGDRYVEGVYGFDTLNNCLLPNQPCRTVAHGVEQAANGDTVRIAGGTYSEQEIYLNKDITLRGGYSPAFTVWDPLLNETILDGGGQQRLLRILGSPTVEWLTVRNGWQNGSGAGIYIEAGSPVIRHNRIISNTATQFGGGICNGADNLIGQPTVEQNWLAGNRAAWGGGFASHAGNPNIWNNMLYQNTATGDGGGLHVGAGDPLLWHNTLYQNTADRWGGGVYLTSGDLRNTIAIGNQALDGGGVFRTGGTIGFNDVWNNACHGPACGADYDSATSRPPTDINSDPLFVNSAQPDLHLQPTSPCMDRASATSLHSDFDGDPRPLNLGPDIGADEYRLAGVRIEPDRTDSGRPRPPQNQIVYHHVVTNTGNTTDTFDLTWRSSQNWLVMVNDSFGQPIVLTLGAGLTASVQVQVEIPTGALSNTVDMTVITATSQYDTDVFDIATDTTIVGRVSEMLFSPDRQAFVHSTPPNPLTVVYTHTLRNLGNFTGTFDLVGVSNHGWVTLVNTPVTIPPGQAVIVQAQVIVPGTIPQNTVVIDTTYFTATSRADSSIRGAVADTTHVNLNPGVRFTPNRTGSGLPGQTVNYAHVLTNTGNTTDTFTFTSRSSQGWTILPLPPSTLPAGGVTSVQALVVIPQQAISGTVDTSIITATSQYSAAVSARVVDVTTVSRLVGVSLDLLCPPCEGWCVNTPPTQTVIYQFRLTNDGNYTDTFDLAAVSQHGWTTSISPNPVVVGPWQSFTITVHLVVPAATGQRVEDMLTVTATSRANPSVWDSATYFTRVNWGIHVNLTPDRQSTVILETRAVYTHTLTNSSPYDANVFQLSGTSDHRWAVQVAPPSVALAPGQSATIYVTVTVPPNAINVVDTATITATATQWCEVTAIVYDRTIVTRPAVRLDPDITAAAPTGVVVTHTHILSNTGAITDSYTLAYASSRGWVVSVTPTSLPLVPPGGQRTVTALVAVPSGTVLSGTMDVLVITATSQFTTSIFDTATDRTVVPHLPGALLTPNGSGAALPGGAAVYTHTLTNSGNYTESYDLTTHNTFGYSVVTPQRVENLAPGASYSPIVVTVVLPSHAAAGEVDLTQVIASFAGQQAVAQDETTVLPTAGTRYVAPQGVDEGNNCAVLDFGPCATVQHAVNQAAPGDEVRVAQGVYTDLHTVGGRTQVVYLDRSVVLRGGYSSDDWNYPDPFAHGTVLDAGGQGRVIYITGDIAPTIDGFHIRNGRVSEGHGGGLYIAAGAQPTVQGNWIYDNAAPQGLGGGLYYVGGGAPLLQRNTAHDNTATQGAGFYIAAGAPSIWNNVFYANQADGPGGGLYNGSSNALVWNNTLYNNTATLGGGIYNYSGSPVISNTILVQNTASSDGGGIYDHPVGGTATLGYNDVWNNAGGDYSGVSAGSTDLSTDPFFLSPATNDLHLAGDSPCIDAADPATTLSLDRDGNLRPLREGFDIGAYEYGLTSGKSAPASAAPGAAIAYTVAITNTGDSPWPGAVVSDPLFPLLGDVISLSYSTGTGEYITATHTVVWTGDLPPHSTVHISFAAPVLGWVAAGTPITNAAWVNYEPTAVVTTVVTALPGARYVRLDGSDTTNNCLLPTFPCRTVQYAVDQALDGDAVRVAQGVYTDALGAGQVVALASPIAVIGGHDPATWAYDPDAYTTTLSAAGGVGATIDGPLSSAATLAGFHVTGGSQGVTVNGATAVISRTRIYGHAGDGLHVTDGALALQRSWLLSNGGDGVDVANGTCVLINNVLANNSGAGLRTSATTATLWHNTLASNTGGGAVVDGSSTLLNTIVYHHAVGVHVTAGSAGLWNTVWWLNTTDTVGNATRVNDIAGDPRFVNPTAMDYHIRASSAALDAGLDVGVHEDVDGGPRPLLSGPDIGADEYPLAVTKFAPPSADPGQVITYSLRVEGEAAGLVITDTLPVYVDGTGFVTCTGGSCGYLPALRTVTWNGSVFAGQPIFITYTAQITSWLAAGVPIVNTAQVQTEGEVLTTAPVTTTVNAVPGTRYVAQTAGSSDVDNNCRQTWKPCATVQYAVDQALPGDMVRVAQGTYTAASDQVALVDQSLALIGGHSPATWAYDPDLYLTTLLAPAGGRGVTVNGPAVVTLAGLRVAGNAEGVSAVGATTTISRTRVYGSTGDGIHVSGGTLTLQRSWVTDNGGDGVELSNASYALVNSVIAHNVGAGLRTDSGSGTLRYNTFARNSGGGAVVGGAASFTNTVFYSHTVALNVTAGSAHLWNTLWWLNTTPAAGNVVSTTNITADPRFVNPATLDYHVRGDSPALDAGLWADVSEDVDGDGRASAWVDIGADQYPLRVSRTTAPDSAPSCGQVAHVIALRNLRPTPLTPVALQETLPPQVNYVPGSLHYSTGSGSVVGDVLDWSGTVATGAWITYSVQLEPLLTGGTAIVHVAAVNDPVSTFDSRPFTVTVAALEVTVSKAAPTQMSIGQEVAYTVVYTVPAGHAAYAPELVDTLPRVVTAGGPTATPALVYVTGSATPPPSSVSGDGGTITWLLPTLTAPTCSAPAVGQVTFAAQVQDLPDNDAGDPLTNTVSLAYVEAPGGPAHTVGATHHATLVEPALTVSKTMLPSSGLGSLDPVAITIVLHNTGSGPLYNAVVTDTLPMMDFVSGTPGCSAVGRLVTCAVDTVEAGQQRMLTITAQLAGDVGAGQSLVNVANAQGWSQPASATVRRLYTGSAQATATTGYPDLVVDKETDAPTPAPGAPIHYTIRYNNAGVVRATSVVIVDTMPALTTDFTYASSRPATVVQSGRVITWTLSAPLDRTVEGTIWITATVHSSAQQGDTLVNTVQVSTSAPEQNLANNTDTVISTVGVYRIYLPVIMRNS